MARFQSSSESPHAQTTPEYRGWFYGIEGEEHGPVDFKTLRSLALDRKLLAHHLVWKGGDEDKHEASAIVGLIPPSPSRSASKPSVSSNPYATPTSRTIAEGPPGGLYLPHLHPASFSLYFASLGLAALLPTWLFFFSEVQSSTTVAFILTVAALGLVSWIALSFIYLHRAWTMMRSFGGALTGGRAVRFLFVPLFNALWCFVALLGWAKFWNFNVRTHPGLKPARSVWLAAFFLFPILFLVSQGLVLMHLFIQEWPNNPENVRHLTALGIWAVTLIVNLICWGQIAQSINFLARKKF